MRNVDDAERYLLRGWKPSVAHPGPMRESPYPGRVLRANHLDATMALKDTACLFLAITLATWLSVAEQMEDPATSACDEPISANATVLLQAPHAAVIASLQEEPSEDTLLLEDMEAAGNEQELRPD
eukprot:s136_g9.t1